MGTYLLRGITTALLVTVLTLFAGIVWGAMGYGGLSTSRLLDIGLLASCLVGGYRTAKESGEWWMGGATGACYVAVGTLLLALFLPIRGWGFIQVLAEGAIIGLVAGAVGAGGAKGVIAGAYQGRRSQSYFKPSYARYGSDDCVSSEFDWDREENPKDRRNSSGLSWMERSEEDLQGTCGAKRDSDSEESKDVEWSWDRVDDKEIALESGDSEPLIVWKPEWDRDEVVRNEVVRNEVVKNEIVKNEVVEKSRSWLKNMSENNKGGARPWWEE